MRTDLTKSAVVLAVGFLVGCALLVVGMRWAIGSALSAHLGALEQLNATMSASAEQVEGAVVHVGGHVTAAGAEVAASLDASSDLLAAKVDSGTVRMSETVEMGFTQPVLIRVSERVPIAGVMAVEGLDQGRPIHVEADVGLVSTAAGVTADQQ